MNDADRIETLKRYLRRTYASNATGLKALAERIATSATSAVTITGHSFEGTQANGSITFEPMAYLAAVEDIIAEIDPASSPTAPNFAYARFGPGCPPSAWSGCS